MVACIGWANQVLGALVVGLVYAPLVRELIDRNRTRLDPFGRGYVLGMPLAAGALTVLLGGPVPCWTMAVLGPVVAMALNAVGLVAMRKHRFLSAAMVLPAFVVTAVLGGAAGRLVLTTVEDLRLPAAILMAGLPLAWAWWEGRRPARTATAWVRTSTVVDADPEEIWERVVRVEPIRLAEWGAYRPLALLGFPVPERAELSYDGPGGVRLGIFSGRVLFEEPVVVWEPGRHVAFDVHASAAAQADMPFDEFTRIGGKYFDVLRAEYVLEPMDDGRTVLHLNSRFRVTTRLNGFTGWWAKLVLGAFQRDVLALVKKRSEAAVFAAEPLPVRAGG